METVFDWLEVKNFQTALLVINQFIRVSSALRGSIFQTFAGETEVE